MDNLTHTLFAVTLARTPLGRAGRGTTAVLILASNAPDIDIVTTAGGASHYLTWHRGPTHGPLGIVGLGLLMAALVWVGRRILDSTRPRPDPQPRNASLPMLALISGIGVLLHILMDLPTSYGTRLLSPFDWHWFSTDWMPIVDVYLLALLTAGLGFGALSADARRRNAAIVLALMSANYGIRAVAHQQALARAPRVFGPLLPKPCDGWNGEEGSLERWPHETRVLAPEPGKRCLVELIALPTFYSPFSWRVIAHLSNAYEIRDISLLDARFRHPPDASEVMWRTTMRVPNIWSPPVLAAASGPLFQRFLGFSRLPAVRVAADPAGAMVRLTDVRFIGPVTFDPAGPRYGLFTVFVRIGPDGRVLSEGLGP